MFFINSLKAVDSKVTTSIFIKILRLTIVCVDQGIEPEKLDAKLI
jgi:hypothetical protein